MTNSITDIINNDNQLGLIYFVSVIMKLYEEHRYSYLIWHVTRKCVFVLFILFCFENVISK